MGNFRNLFIKSQLALLQEGVMRLRWNPACRKSLTQGQSGYMFGVEEAQFLLHEIAAIACAKQLALWVVLGDFRKAFPNVWREQLVCLSRDQVGFDGGSRALLADFLVEDVVSVWQNGISTVSVTIGIPEGAVSARYYTIHSRVHG